MASIIAWLDYFWLFLWSYIKHLIYKEQPNNLEDLIARIVGALRTDDHIWSFTKKCDVVLWTIRTSLMKFCILNISQNLHYSTEGKFYDTICTNFKPHWKNICLTILSKCMALRSGYFVHFCIQVLLYSFIFRQVKFISLNIR